MRTNLTTNRTNNLIDMQHAAGSREASGQRTSWTPSRVRRRADMLSMVWCRDASAAVNELTGVGGMMGAAAAVGLGAVAGVSAAVGGAAGAAMSESARPSTAGDGGTGGRAGA